MASGHCAHLKWGKTKIDRFNSGKEEKNEALYIQNGQNARKWRANGRIEWEQVTHSFRTIQIILFTWHCPQKMKNDTIEWNRSITRCYSLKFNSQQRRFFVFDTQNFNFSSAKWNNTINELDWRKRNSFFFFHSLSVFSFFYTFCVVVDESKESAKWWWIYTFCPL